MGCLVLLLALVGCPSYRASVESVQDEMIVKLVADPSASYHHPVTLTPQELNAILEHVQVEYKAGWLQKLITGPLKPLPLFAPERLRRLVPALSRAFQQATPHDRIVFYVAERRSDVRREVTSGSLFVTDGLLHVVLNNHLSGVDVVPGVPAYDRGNPEIAVAPQRFILAYDRPEFAVNATPTMAEALFETAPPSLSVDYPLFLRMVRTPATRTRAADGRDFVLLFSTGRGGTVKETSLQ
jgi:hypothetical protein